MGSAPGGCLPQPLTRGLSSGGRSGRGTPGPSGDAAGGHRDPEGVSPAHSSAGLAVTLIQSQPFLKYEA